MVNDASEKVFPRIVLPRVRIDPKGQKTCEVSIVYFLERNNRNPSLIRKTNAMMKRLTKINDMNSVLSLDHVQLKAREKIITASTKAILSWNIFRFSYRATTISIPIEAAGR